MSEEPEITEEGHHVSPQAEAERASDEAGKGGEPNSDHLRLLEAVLFSAAEPMTEETIGQRLPEGADIAGLLGALADHYANHGINLVRAGDRWLFRTAEDLSEVLRVYKTVPRRLSRAAMETLAIIAYHQPVTRAEIEEIRGVGLSRGTLDLLLEAKWVAPKGRRRTAGRPATWGTTSGFLVDFGIESIKDLPGLDDLKSAGLLDKRPAMEIGEFLRPSEGDDIADGEGEDWGAEEREESGTLEHGKEGPEGDGDGGGMKPHGDRNGTTARPDAKKTLF
jgi:segregation and condensation protein B